MAWSSSSHHFFSGGGTDALSFFGARWPSCFFWRWMQRKTRGGFGSFSFFGRQKNAGSSPFLNRCAGAEEEPTIGSRMTMLMARHDVGYGIDLAEKQPNDESERDNEERA
jgi:hypothetical protein